MLPCCHFYIKSYSKPQHGVVAVTVLDYTILFYRVVAKPTRDYSTILFYWVVAIPLLDYTILFFWVVALPLLDYTISFHLVVALPLLYYSLYDLSWIVALILLDLGIAATIVLIWSLRPRLIFFYVIWSWVVSSIGASCMVVSILSHDNIKSN